MTEHRTPNDEIEVTPEMIEAGLDALYKANLFEATEDRARAGVKRIYRAMERVRT